MIKRTNLKMLLVMAVLFVGMAPAVAAGGTIYVDADASLGGDGTTWGTAYKYLQDALAVAGDGNDIWVAQGTYYPDANTANPGGSNSRQATFQLISGVGIYGGYPPGGGNRDPSTYETILSGDINTPGDNSDNSYTVVTGSGTDANALLDGFTITAGNANGSGTNDRGGGMYNNAGSPTVTNCTFIGNSADWGGGMLNQLDSNPRVTNCTFSGNSAYNYYGGGMLNDTGSSPTVTGCTFSGNSANNGGGMHNYDNSSPTVTNCSFSGNSANVLGGGMFNGINSNPTVTNCTFSGNSAVSNGGGMCNEQNSSPTVTNCAFGGNSAGWGGGGMFNGDNSSPTLANCILWGNTAPNGAQIYNDSSPSSATVSYSDVQAGSTGPGPVNWGSGNIDEDPLFIDPNGLDGIGGTADDEEGYVHLRGYSPCINAGDPGGDYSGQVDIDGQPRVAYGRVDMGADEVFPIAGDFEPDGDVDFVDFAIFAGNWLMGVE